MQTLSMRDQLYLDHKDDDNNALFEEGKSKWIENILYNVLCILILQSGFLLL